jgi:hypothetical protein
MKLYHQTSRENLSSIFRKGLMPNEIGIIYLTPLLGLGFGEITLEVETGNNRLTAFEDCSDWEVLCWGQICPENIKTLVWGRNYERSKLMSRKRYKVEFSVYISDEIKKKDVEEWIKFEIGYTNQMSEENPLCGKDLEANWINIQ